jgi:ferrochelatase
MQTNDKEMIPWTWGFTSSAENWNGRFAMLGFFLTLVIEFITGKGLLHFLGLI